MEVPDFLLKKTQELKKFFDLSDIYVGSLKPKATTRKKAVKKRRTSSASGPRESREPAGGGNESIVGRSHPRMVATGLPPEHTAVHRKYPLEFPFMLRFSLCAAVASTLFLAMPTLAGETQPVRMGCGLMTFDTVPGWGLRPDGQSALGPTHGSVVVDREGNVYVSANKGVVAFSPEGVVVQSYEGDQYSNIHDMKIREEGGVDYIYGARNANAEGIKFNAHTGEIVLKLGYPTESGLNLTQFNPTAVAVAPNGDIFLADGYGSDHVFRYDAGGKYLMHFGSHGNELMQFNVAHGMVMDTRYDPPLLLICDRNHEPKGRLLHYDLEGNFVAEVVTGLGMPTSAAIQGDYVSVPDLHGRVVILDRSNTIMAVLGHNPDPAKGRSFDIPQDQWVEGIFSGTHGSYWDAEGNLYVQDWNVSGRIVKLARVR